MENILTVKNLSVTIKGKELINVEKFEIREGSVIAVIGENGAGKTTFLLTLASLIKPTTGEIWFYNKQIGKQISQKDFRKQIAVVFQENFLLDKSVYENVAIGLKFRNFSERLIKDRVDDILKLLKIHEIKERKAKDLSGGEAKRVSIARALVIEPKILILDEPFSSLDSISKESIIIDMGRLIKEKNITTLISTHDKYEALRLADYISAFEKGKIIQEGTKDEVLHYPKNSFIASFAGVENILEGEVIEKKEGGFIARVLNTVVEGVGDFEVGKKVYLCIRPENIFLSKSEMKTSVRNLFKGKIIEINNFGYYYRITIDCNFSLISYITKTSFAEMCINIGDEIFVGFKATSIHTIEKI